MTSVTIICNCLEMTYLCSAALTLPNSVPLCCVNPVPGLGISIEILTAHFPGLKDSPVNRTLTEPGLAITEIAVEDKEISRCFETREKCW